MASLRYVVCVLALVGSVMPAAAQKTFPDTGSSPQGALPGPNATPAAADAHPANADLNVQPVPGAWPGSDTIPSTMSEKHAADDKLIIVAYTFKDLSAEERAALASGLATRGAPVALDAEIGTELPMSVDLRPLPDGVVAKVPRAKGYVYVASKDKKVFLVQAMTRFVVAVLDEPAAATVGAGSSSR